MQRAQQSKVAKQISDFASGHEFFADVQSDMAGLIEAGVATDMESAYNVAITLPKHREIAAVIEQRKAAEAARTGQPAIERAVAAASTVRASPVTAPAVAPKGLRATLERNLSRK